MSHNDKTADLFSEVNAEREQARVEEQYTEEYFQVDDGYFQGKSCLDVGCGAQPVGTKRLFEMGADSVTAVDIDEKIKTVGRKYLDSFSEDVTFVVDDVAEFSEREETFDHIHAAGSLHHMQNKDTVFSTIRNLSELTTKSMFLSITGPGGILKDINDTLRKKYKQDSEFQELIDNLEADDISNMCAFVRNNLDDYTAEFVVAYLQSEIDQDLVLTIKDRICSPTYLRFSESELREFLTTECEFGTIRRLKYYPRMTNIRKLLAPFYHEYNNEYASILYGEGFIQLWCKK